MPAQKWNTVSLKPLTVPLDTQGRLSDPVPGAMMWKQNLAVTPHGKLCRQTGFQKLFSGSPYVNSDHHHQGFAVRQPITFLFESTDSEGLRRLFDGTEKSLSVLNESTGLWTDLATDMGSSDSPNVSGIRWHAAQLADKVLFTNGSDDVLYHDLGSASAQIIPELKNTVGLTRASVIVEFNGFILLMNVKEGATEHSSRIRWCDLNAPMWWEEGATHDGVDSLAGFQDLTYGQRILGAVPMQGSLYIFTNQSIWRCSLNVTATDLGAMNTVFDFREIYADPRNESKCLAYPNTLISTGSEIRYMGRDGIYNFNSYIAEPELQPWVDRAAGVVFSNAATRVNANCCSSAIMEYRPDVKELWLSWPSVSGGYCINDQTLVLSLPYQTASLMDAGFTALVNYRPNQTTPLICNQTQVFVGASGYDLALKSIGTVFSREYVSINPASPFADQAMAASYVTTGYTSIMRGLMPLGLPDNEKIVRNVLLDQVTSYQAVPCIIRLRVGTSYKNTDPNASGESCDVLWHLIGDLPLACPPDNPTLALMAAENLRPDFGTGTEWVTYEVGRFLWFEFTILNPDGTPAIGGDAYMERIDFEAAVA